MSLRRTLLFLACTLALIGQGAQAQITRNAALMVSPTFPESSPSAPIVQWQPAGIPDSTTLTTQRSGQGLISTATFFQSSPTWMTPIPADDPTVEQEFLQQVVVDDATLLTSGYVRSGLARKGFQIPQGRVTLIVDTETAQELRSELDRLADDLQREGWLVYQEVVPTTAAPQDVKQAIYRTLRSEQQRWETRPLHVLLIGALPYAMSGGYSVEGAIPNPDFHPEHGGAWSSDAYYADTETSPGVDAEYQWTDEFVEIRDPANALREENRNVPGDGKFDQSILPSDLEICVGRIDMRDLPTFGTSPTNRQGEFSLLKAYLDKNHAYRSRAYVAPMRAVVDDNFGLFARGTDDVRIIEAFATSGWRSFSAIVGADSVVEGDWIRDSLTTKATLDTFPSILAYGCGGGGYSHCDFVANVEELREQPVYSVFTLLFGSYFADVNSTDNIMRASLANEGWILTSGWSGRPHWFLHPLTNGNTIGECQRLSANNNGSYIGATIQDLNTGEFGAFQLGERNIHIMLIGDPTLTLQGPTIPGVLTISGVPPTHPDSTALALTWARSPEHGSTTSARVAYLIEAGTGDGTYRVLDTVPPTDAPTVTRTLNVPDYHYQLRVRPYFTADGRLAPISGRGVMGAFPALSVHIEQLDANLEPRMWRVIDVTGRTVYRTFGALHRVRTSMAESPLPTGVYVITDGRSTVRTITFSR